MKIWRHLAKKEPLPVLERVAFCCAGKSSAEDKRKEDPEAEVSSEVWGTMHDGGNTHAFLDDEKKIDFLGEEDESVLGIGGQRAGESHTENH